MKKLIAKAIAYPFGLLLMAVLWLSSALGKLGKPPE